jgi:cell division septal protein FtsQ
MNSLKKSNRDRYQRGKYHNPYFSHEKHFWPWKTIVVAICTPALVVVGLCFLFSHQAFQIETVSVFGLRQTSKIDFESQVNAYLDSRSLLFFHKSNMFLFNKDELNIQLTKNLSLANVEIDNYDKGIKIKIEERTSNYLWRSGSKTYVVDLDGLIVREMSPSSLNESSLLLFVDLNESEINIGSNVLTKEEILDISNFHKQIGELGITFTQTNINRVAGKWMSLVTSNGYEVYFDASGDIETQVAHLKTLLDQKLIDPASIEYVDLRFGEQIYYK